MLPMRIEGSISSPPIGSTGQNEASQGATERRKGTVHCLSAWDMLENLSARISSGVFYGKSLSEDRLRGKNRVGGPRVSDTVYTRVLLWKLTTHVRL